MSTYIHELPDWPLFRWDHEALAIPLAGARHRQGRLLGQMEALGFKVREQAVLRALTDDVLKTSDIEGETLDADQVRSSLARRLGIDIGGLTPVDRHVEGVVEMMLDATQQYDRPLTQERLFAWQSALFPTGRSGMHPVTVGAWRDDRMAPMQVVSGPVGRERVHFEAPPASRLEDEMRAFLDWFNDDLTTEAGAESRPGASVVRHDSPVRRRQRADRAGDRRHGAGQVGGQLAAVLQHVRSDPAGARRVLPHPGADSARERWTSRHGWRGFSAASREPSRARTTAMSGVIAKARFWEKLHDVPLNERQRLVINRLLDGFDGNLTTSKWATLTKSSQDTALRDILWLVERGVLVRNAAGGRSTSYSLAAR